MVMIVEYRIPLPLTREEYRIAQLYMLSKKAREESQGEESGIEILVNEPYMDGPGPDGCGQYTRKVYYVGSHLPAWLKSLIPKSALAVEEEAWNAYPYTKTRFTCPFVEKFCIEVETYYFNDGGHQDNVFNLSMSELKQREVDTIDIVRDQISSHDYNEDEDPRKYISQKTSRGPLIDDWIDEYWSECKGMDTPLHNGKAIMCAYKLCKVEFRYWGMQNKIEKFIHELALRKTMLRAHRQAWSWLDEWWGLTIDDIRNLEKETQALLAQKYGKDDANGDDLSDDNESQVFESALNLSDNNSLEQAEGVTIRLTEPQERPKKTSFPRTASRSTLQSQVNTRMESIRHESMTSLSDDEFYDCQEDKEISINKWSSLEVIPQEECYVMSSPESRYSQGGPQRLDTGQLGWPMDSSPANTPSVSPSHGQVTCSTSLLVLVVHAGSVLDHSSEVNAKKSDVMTFKGSFELVIRQHYPHLVDRVAIRLIGASSVFTDILNILSSLNPLDANSGPNGYAPNGQIPVSALPLLGTLGPEYDEAVGKLVQAINSTYLEFMHSEGQGFNGEICLVGDSVGGLMCYDALTNSLDRPVREKLSPGEDLAHGDNFRKISTGSDGTSQESVVGERRTYRPLSAYQRLSSSSSDRGRDKIQFDVNSLFLFGCPLALVLVHRKMVHNEKSDSIPRPHCDQVYNLFHSTDPLAARLEPLISARFSLVPTVTIPRYGKYPLGDGQPTSLLECVQARGSLFHEQPSSFSPPSQRRLSDTSIASCVSGVIDFLPLTFINALSKRWWGTKRLDYALYCPEGLANFPPNALPHLFHASYWESLDVVAFILRQVVKRDFHEAITEGKEMSPFLPSIPREKWLRKRTSVKVKNIAANHRGNDIIIKKGLSQEIQCRFMYGPLDMVALTGEKIDLHVMKNPPGGNWDLVGTTITDKNGKISFALPADKQMNCGIFPLKAIVRGDHSICSLYLAVIPTQTQCVVFSIDGSFTASVSVTGKDPKVRAGAVDIVRHWQELGYLIVYVTGRPDLQKRRVVSWLAQHNFPHGLVSFADGISTAPLGHKTDFLKSLVQESEMLIEAGYGSAKDISVYSNIGLTPAQIYIVGKASKKQHASCQVLSDGYAAHLSRLSSLENTKPAKVNPEMLIPKAFFGLPGCNSTLRRRRSAKRTTSHPVLGACPNDGILQARNTLHSTPCHSTTKFYKQ